ncbi:MAG TPA: C4-dicarboxylate ABC transporter substrate-binding protein, partial [Candidatus Methylomirabilis sp.]|nr:C4-dicarboxylate ABC transporter substrate-binding protein [Candidatus Methylomirabilis sp.]
MRDILKIYVPVVLLVAAGFGLAYHFVNPAPPRKIRIAAGPEQGAYMESAIRYREILARDGITLEVMATSGSMQNLQLLQAAVNGVDVAFVQGGTASGDAPGLMSLASVFFEPL